MIEEIRKTELDLELLFGSCMDFSKNLKRYYDPVLPDMHDLNQFEYAEDVSLEEIKAAIDYQIKRGDDFVKFEGRTRLAKEIVSNLLLEEGCELTMLLSDSNPRDWNRNTRVEIRNLHDDNIADDLFSLEMKLYASQYGEDFTKRKMLHWIDFAKKSRELNFHAAYLDGQIVGSMFSFNHNGFVSLDGLAVDPEFRNSYVATTLMAETILENEGLVFLHADEDDTPKEMYKKLGFKEIDKKYEYLKLNLAK